MFGVAVALLATSVALLQLNRRVNRAIEPPVTGERPVEFVAVPERAVLPFWGSEDVESVITVPGGLYAAGASGVSRIEIAGNGIVDRLDRIDISMSLPTRHATALSSWRSDLVAGLDQGGLFLYRDGFWSEVRSGFGVLHVRALDESQAGELWIGAREGLFRLGLAERTMARLHTSPVRSVAVLDGGRVLSGGETGLFVSQGGITTPIRIEGLDPVWVDEVAVFDRRIHAVTPLGLFGEGRDGVLRSIANGGNVGSIAVQGEWLFATADPPDASLRRLDAAGRFQVEQLPSAIRRVFTVGDRLVADTQNGLVERSSGGWRVFSKRRQRGSFGHAHVGALAGYRDRLVVGFFDGGLAEVVDAPPLAGTPPSGARESEAAMVLRPLDASSAVWAVNALLDAGGALHVASLRGAFRFDGAGTTALEGSGAAFSLALTAGGIAIGYGEGVLLPEQKLLSAFHGLPGNQATALAALEGGLLVGTPSGLGYVEGRKVRWRVASGDGKLPHPWVTALLPTQGGVLVGTYGGGLTRRIGAMSGASEWRPFAETDGLKINTGCLIKANGRIYAGTDGDGLWRLSVDGTRFERLKLSLPSPRVTALFEKDGFLYIGTDEGLTRWASEK